MERGPHNTSVPPHPVTPLPPRSLPEAEGSVENDSFEVAESQAIMSRLQWDGSSDISPSDSASSKASERLRAAAGQMLGGGANTVAWAKLGVPGVPSGRGWTGRSGHPPSWGSGEHFGVHHWGVGDPSLLGGAPAGPAVPPPSLPFSPPPRYQQLRVPQDQEEEAPLGAGERRPGAGLQQEEEAQAPRPPHPQHLRRHQLSAAEPVAVGGAPDRRTDAARAAPPTPGTDTKRVPGARRMEDLGHCRCGEGWRLDLGPPISAPRPPCGPPPPLGASIYSVT